MTVKHNKKEIRTLITNKKKAMSVEEITAGSRIITDRLELSKEYQDNDNILIYNALISWRNQLAFLLISVFKLLSPPSRVLL